jgi:hypothetical protein
LKRKIDSKEREGIDLRGRRSPLCPIPRVDIVGHMDSWSPLKTFKRLQGELTPYLWPTCVVATTSTPQLRREPSQ